MKIKSLVIAAFFAALTSCSTPAPKGELPSTANPHEEVAKLASEIDTARSNNVDVLARADFKKAESSLEDAKEKLAKGKEQEKILDDLRFGRFHLRTANEAAMSRQGKATGLFESRQQTLKAGVMNFPALKKEMSKVDEEIADEATELGKVSTKEITSWQQQYARLEQRAAVETQLGTAKAMYNGAVKESAAKKAPQTFRKSEQSIKNAETVVLANVKNPAGYEKSVAQANADAQLLSDVMATIKQNGGRLPETAALQIVGQRKQISGLKQNLSTVEQNIQGVKSELNVTNQTLAEKQKALADQQKALADKQKALDETDKTLKEKENALTTAQTSVALQAAIEKSRSQFSENEAEAYQQGGSLLIRLKSMNFENGKAELPSNSTSLLSKVSEVAKSLNAKEIVVEGHTDSTGSSELNKKLSEERAEVVAEYFKENGLNSATIEAEGHGFEKPIASNKTKEGRAQNRRVDIIITPPSLDADKSVNQ